jgi:hypothetical protein
LIDNFALTNRRHLRAKRLQVPFLFFVGSLCAGFFVFCVFCRALPTGVLRGLGRATAGRLFDWLDGLLACWTTCWMACWTLAGRLLACWTLAGLLDGLLACWTLAGRLLACWTAF